MAVSKVILNGVTEIDLTADSATADEVASGETFHLANGTQATGTAAAPTGTKQISISGAGTVTEDVTNYANAEITTPSGTAGTPTATKGTVSNHSVSVTPSVTNTTGFITGSTKTGTAVSVSASELVSGSETKTANGTYDVANLAQLVVNVSGGVTPTGTISISSNGTYNVTDYAAAEVSVGSSGLYPQFGTNTERIAHYTETINLANDTTYDTATLSTTAKLIASGNTSAVRLTLDLAQYSYIIIPQFYVDVALKSGATLAAIPVKMGGYWEYFCYSYPDTKAVAENGQYTKAVTSSAYASSGGWYYYTSNGTIDWYRAGSVSDGPMYLSSSTISLTNNNLTVSRGIIYAKINSTRFDTARVTDVDSANTNMHVTIDVYRTPMTSAPVGWQLEQWRTSMLLT